MKVGLSTRTIEPALRPTLDGLGVYTAALLQHLPAQGLEVQGYAWPPAAGTLQFSQPFPGSYRQHLCQTLLGAGPTLRVPVNVMHFTDHQVVRTRVPSVATVHDAVPLKYPQWVGGRGRKLKNWALQRTIASADHFIAVSHFATTELIEYYRLPAARISVVPCGIDADWLQALPANARSLRQQWQLPERPYFLFVGTFQPRKNLNRVIAAHRQLPADLRNEYPLVVVGEPGWDCDHTVHTLQQAQAANDNILWLRGLRDRQVLRAIYGGALALVFPSLYEGFGLPVLEAFASGTAVITSTAASLPEVAGDAAVLVRPEDTEAIAHAMQTLATDPEQRARLCGQGKTRAAQFSWDHTAARLASLYRELSASTT